MNFFLCVQQATEHDMRTAEGSGLYVNSFRVEREVSQFLSKKYTKKDYCYLYQKHLYFWPLLVKRWKAVPSDRWYKRAHWFQIFLIYKTESVTLF